MEGSKAGLLGARLFQLLCAVVVLGTSADYVTVIDDANLRGADARAISGLTRAVDFGVFVGLWGVIAAAVGLASLFLSVLPWIAVVVVDALAAIFFLAGGIDTAVWLGGIFGQDFCAFPGTKCSEIKADAAFELLGFLVTLVIIILVFLWQRRR